VKNIGDKERTRRNIHFQEELESLNKAWLTSSLLEQILRNDYKKVPSNWPIIFVQTPTTTQPEEIGGKHGQEP